MLVLALCLVLIQSTGTLLLLNLQASSVPLKRYRQPVSGGHLVKFSLLVSSISLPIDAPQDISHAAPPLVVHASASRVN